VGTCGERRGVSGGVSAEMMMAPGSTAHLAWRGADAAAACDARTAVVDGSLGSGRQSAAAGNGEARRCARGGVGSGAALRPRAWHAWTRGRSKQVYTRAHGVGQRRPARPIGARHCTTLTMTSGPCASAIF
jgi:hypothetical protein